MLSAVIDTHAAIWYLYNDTRLSQPARNLIESTAANGDQIGISSISVIEIIYLVEKARIPSDTYTRLSASLRKLDSVFFDIPLSLSIAQSIQQVSRLQVPDMPDRIIAGTALHNKVPLISRDARIQASKIETVW